MLEFKAAFCIGIQSLSGVFGLLKNAIHFLVFVALSTLSAIIFYPLFFLTFPPILLYRQIVQFIVQSSNPKCRAMISGMNAVMAADSPYEKPFTILAPYFVFTSKLDRNNIIKIVNEQIITLNMYPELTQRIVRKHGYYFWWSVDKFNVENHVKYLNPEYPNKPLTRKEIRRLGFEKMGTLPFDPNYSPWEIVLVPNLLDENNPDVKSAVFIRVNHCLMDGYSLVNFTQKLALKPWTITVGQAFMKRKSDTHAKIQAAVQLFKVLLTGPYHLLNFMCIANGKTDFQTKALEIWKTMETNKYSVMEKEPERIDGERLKRIRNLHKVNVSSVYLTCAMEAVTRYIKKECEKGFSPMPDKIVLQMSFPLPSHPDAMTNHWGLVALPIDVNKKNDSLKTLKNIHQQYEDLKHSIVPLVSLVVSNLMGILPICWHPGPESLPAQTVIGSSIPGPKEKSEMFGYEIESGGLSGTAGGGPAFVISCQNIYGKFWVDIGGIGSILKTQEELNGLQDSIMNVLSELEAAGDPCNNGIIGKQE